MFDGISTTRGVVGTEELIASDTDEEDKFRIVKNVWFEGVGFVTANLFMRRALVGRLRGFDERFDHPHFREDTDLAWRALRLGRIPFGRDVRVPHPARRYIELLQAEAPYRKEASFWEYFLEGMVRQGVRSPIERLGPFMPVEMQLAVEDLSLGLAGSLAL